MTPKEKAFKMLENARMIAMQPAMSYFDNNDACNSYYKLLTLLQVDAIESTGTLQRRDCGYLSLSISNKEYWIEVRNAIMSY